jgi:hypothetical protein
MKTRTQSRALELMARVARVREIQAKQALARAIERKVEQQEHTTQARARVDRSSAALQSVLQRPLIDLARLPLLQELSMHVDATLVGERERLTECEQQVVDQAGVTGKQARHRERLEEKAGAVSDADRQAHEARQLQFATDGWLAYRQGRMT